jgi:hypothetical protein
MFGGQPIYSAQPSYLALPLTGPITLDWPLETNEGTNVLATIIDVTPDAPARVITMPDARQGTPGYAVTFSNVGANTFTVNDNTGVGLLSVASGERWTLYLRTNATQAGTWGIFQQGAGTSTANAGSLAGAGLKAIAATLNTKMFVAGKAVNYVAVNGDRASILAWTAGVGQITMPDPAVVGSDWYVGVKNAGSGSLTVVPTAGLIDGSGSLVLSTGESAFFYTDGANFFTIGFGQEVNSVFDFISINVGGTGDFVLSGAQLNRVSYKLTGVLTGNRNIIVPASTQQYWIDNETTGAFTVTIKCTGGIDPGKTIAQANRNIFYCDGASVLDAVSGAFTPPLAIAAGGTGATNAANARTNLGSTTVGDAVFIAASAAAARLALGSTATGDAVFIAASAAAARAALGSGATGDAIFIAANMAAARAQVGEFTIVKTVNEDRTSTTVLANDAQLLIAGLPANKIFEFDAYLIWTQQGVTTNGIKVAPVGSAGGTVATWEADGTINTSTANQNLTSNASISAGTMAQQLGAGGTTGQVMKIKGVFTTGGAGGTLNITWAQNTSDPTATRMFLNSYLKVKQLN